MTRTRFTQQDIDRLISRGFKVSGQPKGEKPVNQKSDANTLILDKTSKYRNKKIKDEDGNVFDSKKEYVRFQELKQWEKIGEISELKRQVVFKLSVCKYIADATYKDKNGIEVVEDTKSAHTRKLPVYRLKKKMMEFELNIKIKEV